MSPLAARALTVLILFTWILGLGLSQSIPGAFVGFDSTIAALLYAGGFLSQFLAIAGSAWTLRLATEMMAEPGPGAWRRVLTVVLSACLAFGVLFSCLPRDDGQGAELLLLLGILACGQLTLSGLSALKQVAQRGPGLVVLATSLSSALRLAGKLTALLASDDVNVRLFHWSNVLGLVADVWQVLTLVLAFTWLLLRQSLVPKAVAAVFLATAPALTWRASASGPGALVRDTLDQFGAAPSPWTPGGLTAAIQLLTLGAALVACISPARRVFPAVAVGLALLGSSLPDVPLGALVLNLAALLLMTTPTLDTTSRPRALPTEAGEVPR